MAGGNSILIFFFDGRLTEKYCVIFGKRILFSSIRPKLQDRLLACRGESDFPIALRSHFFAFLTNQLAIPNSNPVTQLHANDASSPSTTSFATKT